MATSIVSNRGAAYVPAPHWFVGLALSVVSVVIGATVYFRLADPVSTGPSISPEGSAARGIAAMSLAENQSALALQLSGLEPGRAYVARLYAGTPDEPSASAGLLGTFVAAPDGTASLNATSVRFGATGALVDLTPELLSDGPKFVNVHKEPTRAVVATASLPS